MAALFSIIRFGVSGAEPLQTNQWMKRVEMLSTAAGTRPSRRKWLCTGHAPIWTNGARAFQIAFDFFFLKKNMKMLSVWNEWPRRPPLEIGAIETCSFSTTSSTRRVAYISSPFALPFELIDTKISDCVTQVNSFRVTSCSLSQEIN